MNSRDPAQQSKTLSANDASSEDEAGRVFDCHPEFSAELYASLTATTLATTNNRVPQLD